MDKQRRERVINRMKQIFVEAKIGKGRMGDFIHEPGPSFSTHKYSDVTLLLTPLGSDVVQDLIVDLSEYFRSDVGEGKLSNEIWQFVFDCFEHNNWERPDIEVLELDPLLARFETHRKERVKPTWVVFPVVGARVPSGETFRQFGLTFASRDDEGAKALVKFAETEVGLDEVHSNDVSLLRECYKSGDALCLISVRGDPESAFGEAVIQVRQRLLLLNLCLHQMGALRPWVCLPTEDSKAQYTAVLLMANGNWGTNGEVGTRRSADSAHGVYLEQKLREVFDASDWIVDLDDVVKSMNQGNATKFERSLFRMWTWLGKAWFSQRSSEIILSATIAIEAGLGLGNEDKLSESVADACAILLESDPKTRLAMWERMKKVYSKRSGIVHSGEESSSGKALAEAAKGIAGGLAFELLVNRHKWRNSDELRAEVRQLRYGVGLPDSTPS